MRARSQFHLRVRPWPIVLALAASAPILALLASRAFDRVVVSNRSMLPTLHPGDRLLIDRRAYWRRGPSRGDVVLLRHPAIPAPAAIKRVVGLPGEHVEVRAGCLTINGRPQSEPYVARATSSPNGDWHLGQDQYVVLGDNRPESRDSRHFGPVTRKAILGRLHHRYRTAPCGESDSSALRHTKA